MSFIARPSVHFLGYIIYGIQMEQRKVQAVNNRPQPTSIKELQHFLGFVNFYQKFIANFSLIASPITSLLRNRPKSLSWSPAATEAFQQLKEAFCTAPIFKYPNLDLPFIVEVDTSTSSLGEVLSQQQRESAQLQSMCLFLT